MLEYKKTCFFYNPFANYSPINKEEYINKTKKMGEQSSSKQHTKEQYVFQSSLNISMSYKQFSILCVNFLDTKENIIINGSFTKLIYSNEYLTMNAIYIHIPIEFYSMSLVSNKTYIYFDPNKPTNMKMIQGLIQIESQLLNYYYDHIIHKNNQNASLTLQKAFSSGCIKLFRSTTSVEKMEENPICKTFILKISGVWNNYQDYGLTYKLFPGFSKIYGKDY